MNAASLNKYEMALSKRAAELRDSLRRRGNIASERAAEYGDRTLQDTEMEFAAQGLEKDYGLLRQVELARKRIGAGTYALCLSCETVIAPTRLDAIPWAIYCVSCQDKVERLHEGAVALRARAA